MKIGNIDYTIKKEYNLSLISDEYIHILKEINEGKSFEDIAENYGQSHTNIRAKAKKAIEILQGKKSSKKVCQNCGKLLDDSEIGKKYCNDCNNGKIYVEEHKKEQHGELTVDLAYRHKGRLHVECTCSCGKKCETLYSRLKSGRTRSCGHLSRKCGIDLAEKTNKYGIKALYDTGEIKHECHVWHCLCTCGKEFDIESNEFQYRKSCGHLYEQSRKKGMKHAHEKLAEYSIDRTSAVRITSKLFKNNASGYKGVSWNKNVQRWQASITFKGKQYYLGTYYTVEDAAKVRRIAEEYTHKDFLRWFSKEFPSLYEKISDRVEMNESEDIKRIQEIKSRNRKTKKRIINYNGEEKPLAELCKDLGKDYDCVYRRIYTQGWSVEKAVETPVMKKRM